MIVALPSFLVATWSDGVFSLTDDAIRQELAGHSVRSLVADGRGGVLGIVGGHSLKRRSPDGQWFSIAHSDLDLYCCVSIGNVAFVGTDDAQILRISPDGTPEKLRGFDAVAGRDKWYAGGMLVDGKYVGPPLGIRSIAATCDGAVLLANVHVGGIPRSTDGGATWEPTIDIAADVHQVCAHPTRPAAAIAAAAVGLCVSSDAGHTWTVERRGLHEPYCSAVAFGRNDIFVAASNGPFAPQGAVYRRPMDSDGPLSPLGGGMPKWTDGTVDTDCIAARDSTIAAIDASGCLYVSSDDGGSWSQPFDRFPSPSGVYIC
ncbi:MAG: hypothetical protein JO030_08740 [Candidatus Eremiobacteraeota bacterium]|nr:hypothetical protein [Candidatus Eremiobacteraeota bacterium]